MPRFNEAIAKQATTHHDAGLQRAKAVSQWFIGDPSWATMILAAYAGVTDGFDGISGEKLREAVIEVEGKTQGELLLAEALGEVV